LWIAYFGAIAPGAGSGEAVPEPSMLSLLIVALAVLPVRRASQFLQKGSHHD
jgi:hypothetical protein